jgi:exosortase
MSSIAAAGPGDQSGSAWRVGGVAAAVLAAGAILFAFPTMVFVARESWSTEQGAHGPIVLATGLWLLHRLWPDARAVARPPARWRVLALLGIFLPLYVLARVTQVVELEGYLMYGTLLVVLYSAIGAEALAKLWFPLFYLGFMFPPPETLVAAATTPMKTGLSQAAIALLHAIGLPIGGRGVMIYIGQYELLVAAACSGLNSIISLSAVSLFYIYIRHQANWRYALVLTLLIVPVALAANFVRVLILILLTYYAGEAAAQGFLHNFAGIAMFAAALLFIFVLDEVLKTAWDRAHGRGARDEREQRDR